MPALRNLPLFPSEPAGEKTSRRTKAQPRPALAPREPPHTATLSRTLARRLWLAVHLPQLALEALQEHSTSQRALGISVAVIDPQSRQQTILACNEKARAAGVRAGQSLNAAIALEPDLKACPRDETRERARLVHLAAWCQKQFTPVVSLAPPDELLLEVKGSLKLFGGARALMERMVAGLREQGVTTRLALAPTPTGSLWLARSQVKGDEATTAGAAIEKPGELVRHLAAVSIGCLRWPEEVIALLLGMGVRTVGDLARLPRAGFARRLGTRWLDELDRAFDRRAEARRRFRSPVRFDARLLPDHEIETAQQLESACTPLLDRLQRFLHERQAAIAVLAVECQHRSQSPTRIRIGLALPSGDVTYVRGLLAERLATLTLPAPVRTLRLRSGALLPALPMNGWLWKQAQAQESVDALPRLIERLRTRLGNEQVFGVCAVEDHRPEWAWRISRENAMSCSDKPQRPVERPLWLLTRPHKISQRGKRLRGPERIETGWWDGREIARDYFEMRDQKGARLWIYRERSAPHGWYLHGLFG